MKASKKIAFVLLLYFVSSSTSFSQTAAHHDSLIKRNLERWIGKQLSVNYETGSAFTLIYFKTENGKPKIVTYRSSNPKFHQALEDALQKYDFELNLDSVEEKNYLATIISISMEDGSERAYFGNGTNQNLLNFTDLKLPPNTVALSPIIWMYYRPSHMQKAPAH